MSVGFHQPGPPGLRSRYEDQHFQYDVCTFSKLDAGKWNHWYANGESPYQCYDGF